MTREEDKFDKKDKAPKSSQVGSSVEVFVSGKTYETKMKSLKKRHVQSHDYNSDVNEDWVTFLKSVGWTRDEV